MTYQPASTPMSGTKDRRVATAFFDSREAAENARDDLVAAGFTPDSVSLAGGDATAGETASTDEPILPEQGGFWHALKEFFLPDQDRYTYAEGMRRGGYVLSLTTSSDEYDRAIDILDADGAVDIDERERNWLAEGWTGYSGVDPMLGVSPDNSTAGFGASLAGEDGFERPQPRMVETGSLTATADADAESRADPTRVGMGDGAPGTLNPDMRERIGSGTASMTPPTPTGPQDATMADNAAEFDRKAAIEDASLGAATRSGAEAPATTSTVGSTNQDTDDMADAWTSRRDTEVRRARVRGFIVDEKTRQNGSGI